jgi:hypothetical protein
MYFSSSIPKLFPYSVTGVVGLLAGEPTWLLFELQIAPLSTMWYYESSLQGGDQESS